MAAALGEDADAEWERIDDFSRLMGAFYFETDI
jgi:hypothetical protein